VLSAIEALSIIGLNSHKIMHAASHIQQLELIDGKLPRRALNLVLDWAELHQVELVEDWQLCLDMQSLKPIPPLE